MNAIRFQSGMMTVCGLYYTDGATVCRCIVSGNPLSFADNRYFKQV